MLLAISLLTLAGSANTDALGPKPTLDFLQSSQDIRAICAKELATAARHIDGIATTTLTHASFTNVVVPLEETLGDFNDRLAAQEFLMHASPIRSVREASARCQGDANNFQSALVSRPDLYRLVARIAARKERLDSHSDRELLSMTLTNFKQAGAALPRVKRQRYLRLVKELIDLTTAFMANLQEAPDGRSGDERIATDNMPLLRRALAVRYEIARIYGYRSWADYVLDGTGMGNARTAWIFLQGLDAAFLPKAWREVRNETYLKRPRAFRSEAELMRDYRVLPNRIPSFALYDEALRVYFPADHVVDAVFALYSRLFHLTISRRLPAKTWSPDVTEWSVRDSMTGRYLGELYLDLFRRGGKEPGGTTFSVLPARRMPNGLYRPTLAVITLDWDAPKRGRPALLLLDDVRTLLHEGAHAMATLLARTPYETLSNGVPMDFTETPSTMFEHWIWNRQILTRFSANIVTGQPLSDELISAILAHRHFGDGYQMTTLIMKAQIDQAFHSNGPNVDTRKLWERIDNAATPFVTSHGRAPESREEMLMNGYDAEFYVYLWSEIYGQDLLGAFAASRLDDPAVGARFRRTILEPAGELDPDDEVRAFLGRPVSAAAFNREYGLGARGISLPKRARHVDRGTLKTFVP